MIETLETFFSEGVSMLEVIQTRKSMSGGYGDEDLTELNLLSLFGKMGRFLAHFHIYTIAYIIAHIYICIIAYIIAYLSF